jgi:hypothetical protein
VLAVVIIVGLLVGVVFGRHTCKRDVSNDKMIISNQYMSCTILGTLAIPLDARRSAASSAVVELRV